MFPICDQSKQRNLIDLLLVKDSLQEILIDGSDNLMQQFDDLHFIVREKKVTVFIFSAKEKKFDKKYERHKMV